MDDQIAPEPSQQLQRVTDTQQHMAEARQRVVETDQTLAAAQQAKTTADQEFTIAARDADFAVQQLADNEGV